jgi:hypothetical protein
MDFEELSNDRKEDAPAPDEVDLAKKVIASLLLAKKNFALYPEGHTICVNALRHLHLQLENFMHKYGDLKLDIEKDQLSTHGEMILSEPPEEGTLPFILYRDGIQWLEFCSGLDPDELQEFLKILCKYSVLSAEPEGDVVTEFWENQLPHIKYQVADFFWGVEEDQKLINPPEKNEKEKSALRENKLAESGSLPDPMIEQTSINLSAEDRVKIKEMIRIEEEGDPTAYLDALLDSLLQHGERDNFEIILDVLDEEFSNSLRRMDFDIAIKILQNLHYVISACSEKNPWAAALIEDFILKVSRTQTLSPLQDVLPGMDAGQMEKLKRLLSLLQPEAIHTIGAMIQQNLPVKLRQMLIDAIVSLASRDYTPLESLLQNPNEKLMERLVQVFVNLEGERPLKALMKLVHHSSPKVRQEAVKAVFQRGPARTKEIFTLIDDNDESVRTLVMKQMGQSRNQAAEKFLLDYLERRKSKNLENEQHILACFAILGQCGSALSIPFLKQILFEGAWKTLFSRSIYREGAANALNKLGVKEARKVLDDAGHSFFPGLRRIGRDPNQGRK